VEPTLGGPIIKIGLDRRIFPRGMKESGMVSNELIKNLDLKKRNRMNLLVIGIKTNYPSDYQ
jgi:hypothetical protein